MRQPLLRHRVWWLAWGALALVNTAQLAVAYGESRLPWHIALRWAATDWLLWAALWPVVAFLARRFPVDGDRRAAHSLAQLACGIVVGAAQLLVFVVLDSFFERPPNARNLTTMDFFVAELRRAGHLRLFTYLALLAVVYAFDFEAKARARERQIGELQASWATARLAFLTAQLRPHFLFNTLNTVHALIRRDAAAAERTLDLLAELLRSSLASEASQEVPLAEELSLLNPYLEIERLRFSDRLTIRHDIAENAGRALVPRFSLQPLLENAIEHGVAHRAGGGHVVIRARRVGDDLVIVVRDDGPGPAPACEFGIGLANTRERFARLYGDACHISLCAEPDGGGRVELALPFRMRP